MGDMEELERLAAMLQRLAHRETTPARIIGTGYKRPRDEAFIYLANRIMDEIRDLRGKDKVEYLGNYFRELRENGQGT